MIDAILALAGALILASLSTFAGHAIGYRKGLKAKAHAEFFRGLREGFSYGRVWRNRRQEPITAPSDDEREALFRALWSAFNPGFSEPLEGERDRAYYLAMADEILAAGFRRQGSQRKENN